MHTVHSNVSLRWQIFAGFMWMRVKSQKCAQVKLGFLVIQIDKLVKTYIAVTVKTHKQKQQQKYALTWCRGTEEDMSWPLRNVWASLLGEGLNVTTPTSLDRELRGQWSSLHYYYSVRVQTCTLTCTVKHKQATQHCDTASYWLAYYFILLSRVHVILTLVRIWLRLAHVQAVDTRPIFSGRGDEASYWLAVVMTI